MISKYFNRENDASIQWLYFFFLLFNNFFFTRAAHLNDVSVFDLIRTYYKQPIDDQYDFGYLNHYKQEQLPISYIYILLCLFIEFCDL